MATDSLLSLNHGRWWRYLLGMLVVLLLLIALAPTLLVRAAVVNGLVSSVAPDLRGSVTVGTASAGWFTPIELENVEVRDAAGRPLLTAARVAGSKSLLDLLGDSSDLGAFRCEQPELQLVCAGGQSNLEQWLASLPVQGESGGASGRVALSVEMIGARLQVRDEDTKHQWDSPAVGLTLVVPKEEAQPLRLEIHGRDATAGRLDVEMTLTLGPSSLPREAKLTVDMGDFPLAALNPLLRRFDAAARLDGRLSARAEVVCSIDAGGQPRVDVQGRVTATQLTVAASCLGPDCVRLDRLDVPCTVALHGRQLEVRRVEANCDVGKFWLTGAADAGDDAVSVLSRPGFEAGADVDLARLAALVPHLLHLQADTRLTAGRLAAQLRTSGRPGETAWDGNLRLSDLRGVSRGRAVTWPEPVALTLQARRTGNSLPSIDMLRCESGFLRANVSGTVDQVALTADADLGKLADSLGQFVDLGTVRLAGAGNARVSVRRGTEGRFTIEGDAGLRNLALVGVAPRPVQEADLTLHVEATGQAASTSTVRLDSALARVRAGAEEAEVRLLEPTTATMPPRARGRVAVRGDATRWQRHVQPWLAALDAWQLGGALDLTALCHCGPEAADLESLQLTVTDARVQGAGLTVSEPRVDVKAAGRWQAATGSIELHDVTLACATATVQAPRLQLAGGVPSGVLNVQADVARLRQVLQPSGAPADIVTGRLTGELRVQPAGAKLALQADLQVQDLVYGPPAATLWREPLLHARGRVQYDGPGDMLLVERLDVEAAAVQVEAAGRLAKLAGPIEVSLTGRCQYDLAKLEPVLQPYLGPGVRLTGRDSRPFHLEGPLVAAPPAMGLPRRLWTGEAGLNWQAAQACGCQVGPVDAHARLGDGWLRVQRIDGTVNQGRLHLEPSVRLEPGPIEMQAAKGNVLDHVKITPAMCASALGYAVPALANAADAEGELSVDLDAARLPAGGLALAEVSGRLSLHHMQLSAGPMLHQLSGLLNGPPTMVLVRDSVVPFQLANGRIHHRDLQLLVGGTTIRTSGSVGLDGSLDLVAEVPLPAKWLGAAASNGQAPVVRLPVRGTVAQPRVDERALREANAQVVRDAAGNVLRKEAEKKLNQLLMPHR